MAPSTSNKLKPTFELKHTNTQNKKSLLGNAYDLRRVQCRSYDSIQ